MILKHESPSKPETNSTDVSINLLNQKQNSSTPYSFKRDFNDVNNHDISVYEHEKKNFDFKKGINEKKDKFEQLKNRNNKLRNFLKEIKLENMNLEKKKPYERSEFTFILIFLSYFLKFNIDNKNEILNLDTHRNFGEDNNLCKNENEYPHFAEFKKEISSLQRNIENIENKLCKH